MSQVAAPPSMPTPSDDPSRAVALAEGLFSTVAAAVRGKDEVVRLSLVALLAGGHLLVEDLPGTGKTLLAKSLATALGGRFRRVQCTPDLLPSDIIGTSVYAPVDGSWNFRPGPLFANVVLVDEINRASPRTQAALLEPMEEHQVSVDGTTYGLPDPFFCIVTQNPYGQVGTFPLPESQVDRFTLVLAMGLPDRNAEREILTGHGGTDVFDDLRAVASPEEVAAAVTAVRHVHGAPAIIEYVLDLAAATRNRPDLTVGASPAPRSASCAPRGPTPWSPAAPTSCPTTSRPWSARRSPTVCRWAARSTPDPPGGSSPRWWPGPPCPAPEPVTDLGPSPAPRSRLRVGGRAPDAPARDRRTPDARPARSIPLRGGGYDRVGGSRLTGPGAVLLVAVIFGVASPPPSTDSQLFTVVWATLTAVLVIGIAVPVVLVRMVRVDATSPRDVAVGVEVGITVELVGRRISLEVRALDPTGPWHRAGAPGRNEVRHLADRRGLFQVIRIEVRVTAPLGVLAAHRVHEIALPHAVEVPRGRSPCHGSRHRRP